MIGIHQTINNSLEIKMKNIALPIIAKIRTESCH